MIEMKYLSIVVFLFVFMIDATIANNTTQDSNADTNLHNNGCECIQYNCGCCRYLNWNEISFHKLICANVSYLDKDYGISFTVTFNGLTVINETISAKNPPPICVGEDVLKLKAELCLRLYDININKKDLHVCFELEGRFFKVKMIPLKLGCVNTNIEMVKKIHEVENMINKSPIVTMV